MNPSHHLFTLPEVASATGRSTRTIERDIDRGILPVIPHGKGVRVTKEALGAYLQRKGVIVDQRGDHACPKLLQELPGLEPGSGPNKCLQALADSLTPALSSSILPRRFGPTVETLIGILQSSIPYTGAGIDFWAAHEDYGSVRIMIGTPAWDIAVIGKIFNIPKDPQCPDTVLQVEGGVVNVLHEDRFDLVLEILGRAFQEDGGPCGMVMRETSANRVQRLRHLVSYPGFGIQQEVTEDPLSGAGQDPR